MLLMIESSMAVRFPSGLRSSSPRFSLSSATTCLRRVCNGFVMRKSNRIGKKNTNGVIRASADHSDPGLERKPKYHPFEEILASNSTESGDARLTPAATSRTIIEVNSKATLIFSGLINDEVQEDIFWPELPYVTDEHGNVYFQVNNDEDFMQILTSENNFVDWVAILEDEVDGMDSDEALEDWAKFETMHSSHPISFAKKLAEVASDDPIDYMDQPPAGLAIQGLLRPALVEEHTIIQRHTLGNQSHKADANHDCKIVKDKPEDLEVINGDRHESGPQDNSVGQGKSEKDESLNNGILFYKLEMIKLELISAQGQQIDVEVEDFMKAQPDAIAHSAAKIISRLKAGGEKTMQALRSLCWRCKGIQVEEATVIGIDTLGFDVRVCSGIQVQTLRFAFQSRATSEYSAERQLNDLLFPRLHHKPQKRKAHQKES
ncbi:hypothetical protein RJ641_007606 [Dillenia turbinata]|uniref:FMN-binding split barrel n=1 Tax=Dillenia turbinata TaxID=194707 RepID=A0AAN8VE86_9MAGN